MPIYQLNEFVPDLPEEGTFWIAPNATLVGNVRLGERTSVWFGAVIRGDNELIDIGAGTNIQDNATLHSDPGFALNIGANCTIGHNAIVHGCTLGTNTMVGMGATLLNGASIGENCLIGANALVTENKIIPNNSLVLGAPAKVVKDLSAEEVRFLEETAPHYVENHQLYAKGLKQL